MMLWLRSVIKVTEIGMILQKLNWLHVIASKKTATFKFFVTPAESFFFFFWVGGWGVGVFVIIPVLVDV